MAEARLLIGDVCDRLAEIPDGTVDLVLTSPPFLALRSYLPADHPDKHREIGSEATPAEFIDTLLALTAEWRRVLAPHGSIAIELGDTYAGSGGGGGDYYEDGLRAGQPGFTGSPSASRDAIREANARHWREKNTDRSAWPLDKSLCLIPELYRVALAYGINPLTGQPSPAGQWRARNVVRWCRPNPPVGALGDKFRPATSEMVIACTARDRYFDLDAVRTPHKADPATYTGNGYTKGQPEGVPGNEAMPGNPAGAPPLDWWEIPTQPYKGAHYATWPEALCIRPILAMSPQRVCTTCGQPSRRVVNLEPGMGGYHPGTNGGSATGGFGRTERTATTLGWTDCGHDTWRPGLVLDPFAGSGTTLAVATGHSRDAIGIDIDERNVWLVRERVGMFLTVEEATQVVA